MKLRNLFITLGLALTVGAGVLVGVNAQHKEEPKVAEAAPANNAYIFQNTKNWDNVYLHLFGGSSSSDTTWPGLELTDIVGQDAGHDMYGWVKDGDWTKFILNNGKGTQTSDLEFSEFTGTNNACWINDSLKIGGVWTYAYTTYNVGYYLVGDKIGWGISNGLQMTETSTNIYSHTKSYDANEKVKVVKNNKIFGTDLTWLTPSSVNSNHSASYPVSEDGGNAKVTNKGNYTLKINVSTNAYNFEANDFITPVVKIYYKDGTTGASSTYNSTKEQSEITVELKENDEFTFQITSSFGTYYYGYSTLETYEGSVVEQNLVEQGTLKSDDVYNIRVKSTLVYSMYVKDSGTVWMQKANDSTQAYAWATYFLDHVGCDSQGVEVPTGWSDVSSRYASLPSTAKETYIINATADEHSTDEIKQALARYDYAVTHHAGLTRFIVGRTVSSNRLNILSQESNSVMPAVIVIIGIMGLTTVAGYYFFKRSKKA